PVPGTLLPGLSPTGSTRAGRWRVARHRSLVIPGRTGRGDAPSSFKQGVRLLHEEGIWADICAGSSVRRGAFWPRGHREAPASVPSMAPSGQAISPIGDVRRTELTNRSPWAKSASIRV